MHETKHGVEASWFTTKEVQKCSLFLKKIFANLLVGYEGAYFGTS
jgi:hypothetical protein